MPEKKALLEIKLATALKYDYAKDDTPSVVASGQGEIAEEIISVAKEFAIPIYKDPPLAKALGQLEIGSIIPEELYKAVAEILIFVYKLDQEKGKSNIYETLLGRA